MGYVDAAKKTTSAVAYTVPSANVRTDISNVKYGAPVVVVYTTSTTENNAHGLYIYPATSTVGTVKTITKEAGAVVSVTLSDGTVLKVSNLQMRDDTEFFVIGNVYTFVLDSHGHIIYATRDYARTLWAYTGEWKYTSEHSAISSDWVTAYRFINVTTGEEAFYPVNFVNLEGNTRAPAKADYAYYDISVTPGADGNYVAERIAAADNTYAAGYVVANATFEINSTNVFAARVLDQTVFFNGETVKFLIATGTGANMKVNSYTGIAALKEAFGVAVNGSVTFTNAALTVSATETGHWNASTIFVMADNVSTTSQYVFIPTDIAADQWTEINGSPNNYQVVYGNGAYLEGAPYSIVFNTALTFNDKLVRGFYSVSTTYNQNGVPTATLQQRMDNGEGNCYYQSVSFISTGVNGGWQFVGKDAQGAEKKFNAVEGTTKVYDLTGRNITTISGLWQYANSGINFAFTVNPYTGIVDYVYVTNSGWDAKYTFTLSSELKAAGWKILLGKDPTATGALVDTYELNDEDAIKKSGQQVTITLYNANLAKEQTVATKYAMTLTENGAVKDGAITNAPLNNGKIEAKFTLAAIDHANNKTFNYVIGGLSLGTVKFAANEGLAIYSGAENKNVVLGQSLTVQVKTSGNVQFKLPDQTVPSSALYNWRGTVTNAANAGDKWTVIGTLNSNSTVVTFSFTPIHIDGTYNVGGVDFPLK